MNHSNKKYVNQLIIMEYQWEYEEDDWDKIKQK